MKLILLIALVLSCISAKNTMEVSQCLGRENCLTKGDEGSRKSATDCLSADTSDQCNYVRSNSPTDFNAGWSEDYGVNWHGCLKKCRDKSTDFIDCYEGCSLPILKVSLAVLTILAWFM